MPQKYKQIAARSTAYSPWRKMRERCRDPKAISYKNYGGRGIKVCERWMNFDNFLEDMGERPSLKHSIERINNNGDYEPSNCRWATHKEQLNNARFNVNLTFRNETRTISQWADALGLDSSVLRGRRHNGWTVERMLTQSLKRSRLHPEGVALEDSVRRRSKGQLGLWERK